MCIMFKENNHQDRFALPHAKTTSATTWKKDAHFCICCFSPCFLKLKSDPRWPGLTLLKGRAGPTRRFSLPPPGTSDHASDSDPWPSCAPGGSPAAPASSSLSWHPRPPLGGRVRRLRPPLFSCRLWDSTWFWFRLRATGLDNSHNLHLNILAPPAVWDRDRDREPSRGSLSGPC